MKIKFLWIILIISIIFSVIISIKNLSFLGLSYDEVLFVNAAILKSNDTFMSRQIFGIPLMVWDHIGALKSWIYFPIFKVFGVSNLSIRIPTLLILLSNLYLIYIIGIKYFNKLIVLSLIIILCTDLSFVNCHVIDHGPTAIETFLKLLAIYLISSSTSKSSFAKITLVLFLGLFNKLNFIWFVNALFAYFIISKIIKYFKSKNSLSENISFSKLTLVKLIISFILLIAYFIFIFNLQHLVSEKPSNLVGWFLQFKSQFKTIAETLINFRYYNYLGWYRPHFLILTAAYIGLTALFFLNLYWVYTKKIKSNQPIFFVFVILIILVLQIIGTKVAWNVWHVLMIYPFIHLLIINSVYLITERFGKSGENIFLCLICIWLGYNIKTQINFEYSLDKESTFNLYQPQINNLIAYTQARKESEIFTLGWGIQSQLLVTDRKSKGYIEFVMNEKLLHFENKLKEIRGFPKNYDDILVVENITGGRYGNRENYDEMRITANKFNLDLIKIKTFNNNSDAPIYNVFKLEPIKFITSK